MDYDLCCVSLKGSERESQDGSDDDEIEIRSTNKQCMTWNRRQGIKVHVNAQCAKECVWTVEDIYIYKFNGIRLYGFTRLGQKLPHNKLI